MTKEQTERALHLLRLAHSVVDDMSDDKEYEIFDWDEHRLVNIVVLETDIRKFMNEFGKSP